MQLTINGSTRELDESSTVREMLLELALDPRAVVVELNREIVRRPSLDSTAINNGDVVEIVHFVGGG